MSVQTVELSAVKARTTVTETQVDTLKRDGKGKTRNLTNNKY